jgi:fused
VLAAAVSTAELPISSSLWKHAPAPSPSPPSSTTSTTSTTSVLALLAACCCEEDKATRKFACFAGAESYISPPSSHHLTHTLSHPVGNAAFHSSHLYSCLHPCLLPLSLALTDPDEKTRANAAGAVGNLVRNGGELAAAMAQLALPDKLLKMCLLDKEVSPQVSVLELVLFSTADCCCSCCCSGSPCFLWAP